LTMERYSHSDHDKELAAMRTLPNLPKPTPKASKAPENTGDSASSVLAFCLALSGTPGEISGDSGRLNEEDKTASQAADEPQLVAVCNGGGEIRTHGTLAGPPVFKTGAINRSATPPIGTARTFVHHQAEIGKMGNGSRAGHPPQQIDLGKIENKKRAPASPTFETGNPCCICSELFLPRTSLITAAPPSRCAVRKISCARL
jgi:hypothetical protein